VAIVVDDAELLTDTPLGNELTACYRRIRDSGHRLLAAAVADGSFGLRGLIPELAKTKCGLILEPTSAAAQGLVQDVPATKPPLHALPPLQQ
jgi:hypothetical protein